MYIYFFISPQEFLKKWIENHIKTVRPEQSSDWINKQTAPEFWPNRGTLWSLGSMESVVSRHTQTHTEGHTAPF